MVLLWECSLDDNNYALREGDPTESGYQRLLKKREFC